MAIAMVGVIDHYADGDAGRAFTIVVLAGVFQIAFGAARIGRLVSYTPHSVVSGFMSGIGMTIIVIQTLPFLGVPVQEGGPLETVMHWPAVLREIDVSALAVAAVTLAISLAWPRRFRKYLPVTMTALVGGTLLSVLWLKGVPVIGDIPGSPPELRTPDLSYDRLVGYIEPALSIALLGCITTLITAQTADSITRQRHNPNRVLIGQGIGNTIVGLVGGVPGAGAPMGTMVNIRAGGTTRAAGVVCALMLLALLLGLSRYLESIPHAVLAGILMKIGWDIVDWRYIKRIRHHQWTYTAVMSGTLTLTVCTDVVTAVVLGLLAAGMASAHQFERLELDNVVSVPLLDRVFLHRDGDSGCGDCNSPGDGTAGWDEFSARVGLVALRGTFTVASSGKLIDTLSSEISEHEVVIIDFSATVYMDDSAALLVEQIIDTAITENTECVIMGSANLPQGSLTALDVLRRVPENQRVDTLDEARELSLRLLNARTPQQPD